MNEKFVMPDFILNPNFKQTGFEENIKVYVVDKDGNRKELPDKYYYHIPKKEENIK